MSIPDEMLQYIGGGKVGDVRSDYRPGELKDCTFMVDTLVPEVSEAYPVNWTTYVSNMGVVFVNIRWLHAPFGLCQAQCVVHLNRDISVFLVHVPTREIDKHIPETVAEQIFTLKVFPNLGKEIDLAIENLARLS